MKECMINLFNQISQLLLKKRLYFYPNLLFLIFSFQTTFSAEKEIYVYHRLVMKDLEQMDTFVSDRIKKSKEAGQNKEELLYEALLTLFSRPNLDNLIEKIAPTLHAELVSQNLHTKLYSQMINEAISTLKSQNLMNIKIDTQLTYLIALENWMVEFRPKATSSDIQKWYQQIADSNLDLSKKQLKHAKIQMPYNLKSPSQLANEILKHKLGKE